MAFATVLGDGLTDDQLEQLFMKIDVNTDNLIDWDDFSSYMLLRAEGKKAMKEALETMLFDCSSSRSGYPMPTYHKEMIVRVQYLQNTRRYMTCCKEGTICYWSEAFKIQRYFKNAGYSLN
jgi:hypothetical protein